MLLTKEFEMYRKLEVVLFRYFKIAEFLEYSLRINIKMSDSYSKVLNPKGYDNCKNRILQTNLEDGSIYIPFNPFYLNKNEEKIFLQMFPEKFWEWNSNENKERRIILKEIWKRIHELKFWLGIIHNTRFCGMRRESRLTTILENYVSTGIKEFKYDFEHSIFRNVSKESINEFLKIVKKKKKKGIYWLRRNSRKK